MDSIKGGMIRMRSPRRGGTLTRGLWQVLGIVCLAVGLISVATQAIEYTSEPHIGDRVRAVLQDGSSYQGDLDEATDSRVVLSTAEGRVVLLRSSVQRIVVLPRIGQPVRLTMVDGTTYRGAWAGQDATHVYVDRDRGEVGLLKSQVDAVEVVREAATTPAFGVETTSGPLRVAIGLGTWHLLPDALSPSPSLIVGLASGDAWIGFQMGLRISANTGPAPTGTAADRRTEIEYQSVGIGTQDLHALFGRTMMKGDLVSLPTARSVFMIGVGSIRQVSGPLYSNAWVAVVLTQQPVTIFGFSVALGSM